MTARKRVASPRSKASAAVRVARESRKSKETDIQVTLNLENTEFELRLDVPIAA